MAGRELAQIAYSKACLTSGSRARAVGAIRGAGGGSVEVGVVADSAQLAPAPGLEREPWPARILLGERN